ncbi:MAG: type I methionyl aminopeptidase [Defluviitaleaceae bacterium]|nr:type I methionyl aminopeptidase [Defluviitaleaceae bacterium]
MIYLKNTQQLLVMKKAGSIVARCLEMLERHIKPGVSTAELNKMAHEFILSHNATPSFLNYKGFPASINTSINEEIVHGIPDSRRLMSGDIIGIDIGVFFSGYHGDAARTFGVGTISEEDERLLEVTKKSFFEGIKYARKGNRLNQICKTIGTYIEDNGFGVIEEFVGHGIGRDIHEMPNIPNHDMGKKGPKIDKGMTFAIEPMVSVGSPESYIVEDGWTAITLDGKNSAHYENTIAITDGEPEILTLY